MQWSIIFGLHILYFSCVKCEVHYCSEFQADMYNVRQAVDAAT